MTKDNITLAMNYLREAAVNIEGAQIEFAQVAEEDISEGFFGAYKDVVAILRSVALIQEKLRELPWV